MAIKLNVSPYFDDFDVAGADGLKPKEKYNRILFRPGHAIQARELTQLQSMLQNQITQHGNHMFKEGSMVIPGGVAYNPKEHWVKCSALSNTSTAVVGKYLKNADGLLAKVKHVVAASGSDPITIYVSYQNSNGSTNTDKVFNDADTLTEAVFDADTSAYITDTSSPVTGTVFGAAGGAVTGTGQGVTANVEAGVYFIRGHFVQVKAAYLILSKYVATLASIDYDVGLSITEELITPASDATLNDNAAGTTNYAAPGAHRYSIKTLFVSQANYATTYTNFLLLIRIVDGKIQQQVRKTDYSVIEDTLARRTFDESGDYSVRPYRMIVKEDTDVNSPGDVTKLVSAIEPSKAYVRGYEIEHLKTTNQQFDKARDSELFEAASVTNSVGNYVHLTYSTVVGLPDITTYQLINLYSAVGGRSAGSQTTLGTAKVRTIERDSTILKVFLFDIVMSGTNAFSAIKSIGQNAASNAAEMWYGNVALDNSKAVLYEPNKNTTLFKLPFDMVRTCDSDLNHASPSTFNYVYFATREFPAVAVGSNQVTVSTLGATELLEPYDADNWFLRVNNTTGTANYDTDINLASATITRADNSQSVTISGSGLSSISDGKSAILIAGVKRTANHGTKSLTTSGSPNVAESAISNQGTIEAGIDTLERADVYRLLHVYMAPNFSTVASASHTDIKEYYDLDNGQRDNFYANGIVSLKSDTNFVPTGRIRIDYEFFTHTDDGTGGQFFTVDSYPIGIADSDGNTFTYEDIPAYRLTSTGQEIELRSAVDFRPRQANGSTNFTGTGAVTKVCPEVATTFTTDVNYFIPRRDKIFLDKRGNFGVVKGVSSLSPQLPDNPKDAMVLAHTFVPAYTLKATDVEIELIDNKRYTMRDIGRLDRRINNLEYYTALSFLEKEASDRQILDTAGVNSRFKNGFMVDSFKSFNVGDIRNKNFRASIDPDKGLLKPQFFQENTRLLHDATTTSGVTKTGDLITLPYTSTPHIQQLQASSFIKVNPYDVFNWDGVLTLSPNSDEWRDVNRLPAVFVDNAAITANLLAAVNASTAFGTVWNDWETSWSGVVSTSVGSWTNSNVGAVTANGTRRDQVTTQEQTVVSVDQTNQSRVGTETVLGWSTTNTSQGDRVVSTDIAPVMRSRFVNFRARGLKPFTKFYAFFDGINVTDYCKETVFANDDAFNFSTVTTEVPTGLNSMTSIAGNTDLISDGTGSIDGTFLVPNNSGLNFTTGTKVLNFTDVANNDLSAATSKTEAQYSATGWVDNTEEVFLSTRVPAATTRAVSDSRILSNTRSLTEQRQLTNTWWVDPLAESFIVDDINGDIFATSIDIYFGERDNAIPVTLQIREMENGVPTQRIAPFGEVTKQASECTESADASAVTTFTFPSPVYLQENVEYCFVLMSNSNAYAVWHAVQGEDDLTGVKINKQPYAGVLFKSQNASSWTADQNADLKFRINRAVFTTGSTGYLGLKNNFPPNVFLQNNAMKFTSGSAVVQVTHPNHGFINTINAQTSKVKFTGCTAAFGITAATLNATAGFVVSNVEQDSYTITLGGNANGTGIGAGANIIASDQRQFSTFKVSVQEMLLSNTNINWSIKKSTGAGLTETSRTPYVLDNAFSAIIPNENMQLLRQAVIATADNKNAATFLAKGIFTSTFDNVSPVVDLQRASLFSIGYRVDNQAGSTTPGFNTLHPTSKYVAETDASNGTSLAKYVTKPAVLNDASTTLKVFLDINRPTGTTISLYFRTAEDETALSTTAWTLGTPQDVIQINDNFNAFSETEWTLNPTNSFKAYAIKLVFTSNNQAVTSQASSLRTIALI